MTIIWNKLHKAHNKVYQNLHRGWKFLCSSPISPYAGRVKLGSNIETSNLCLHQIVSIGHPQITLVQAMHRYTVVLLFSDHPYLYLILMQLACPFSWWVCKLVRLSWNKFATFGTSVWNNHNTTTSPLAVEITWWTVNYAAGHSVNNPSPNQDADWEVRMSWLLQMSVPKAGKTWIIMII